MALVTVVAVVAVLAAAAIAAVVALVAVCLLYTSGFDALRKLITQACEG